MELGKFYTILQIIELIPALNKRQIIAEINNGSLIAKKIGKSDFIITEANLAAWINTPYVPEEKTKTVRTQEQKDAAAAKRKETIAKREKEKAEAEVKKKK